MCVYIYMCVCVRVCVCVHVCARICTYTVYVCFGVCIMDVKTVV